MNGPALRISSRMFAPATSRKMSLPCSPAYWRMRPTSARREWRAHPRGSALTRSAGCAPSMLGRRPIVPRRHLLPMRTPDIRIPACGATARHLRQMANSSARATEPQSAATLICITAANPGRNSTAICQISTATSAFCPSVRRPMCSMGHSIRTRCSTSRNTLLTRAVRVITSSGCSP